MTSLFSVAEFRIRLIIAYVNMLAIRGDISPSLFNCSTAETGWFSILKGRLRSSKADM